ncbi:MAG: hypothetical protein ACTTI4_00665 [Prevotella fusca]|uniref:hypothetical protein n=1 Tax=Prevotella fusca TaxID=589436 RepID=UPI003FA1156A
MKTYVITLSSHFLANHKRAGEETHFKEKFLLGQGLTDYDTPSMAKIHTIRANYPLWEKRIKEVQEGRAALSIRQWTGKPYRSKQVEIARLTAANGVGIQKLEIFDLMRPAKVDGRLVDLMDLAHNDGLPFSDWYHWFRVYDLSNPMAIIHFTKFRY